MKSRGHGFVLPLCFVQHLPAALTALTLISGFSCDGNDNMSIVFIWQETECFGQVIQCIKSLASKTEGVFSHHTGISG